MSARGPGRPKASSLQTGLNVHVLVRGCLVSLRLCGEDGPPLVGEVTRTEKNGTFGFWPLGWDAPTTLNIGEVATATIAEMNREALREVRARQKGGQR